MKAEDVAELYDVSMSMFDAFRAGRFNGLWRLLNDGERAWLQRFADSAERRARAEAIAKAKELATKSYSFGGGQLVINWSALDAWAKEQDG